MTAFLLIAAAMLTDGTVGTTCKLVDGTGPTLRPTLTPYMASASNNRSSQTLTLRLVRSSQDGCAPRISAIDDEYLYLDDGSIFKEGTTRGLFRKLGKGSKLKYNPKAPPPLFEGLPLRSAAYVLGAGNYLGLWSDGKRSIVGTFVDGEPSTTKRLGMMNAAARSISFAGAPDTPAGIIYIVGGTSSSTVLLSYRWDHRTWSW